MWNNDDDRLTPYFKHLDLHEGITTKTMQAIYNYRECETNNKYNWTNIVYYAAIALLSFSSLFLLININKILSYDIITGIIKIITISAFILIGGILVFLAKPLARFDNMIICRITGRCDDVGYIDIALIRLGAIVLLVFSGIIQLGIL